MRPKEIDIEWTPSEIDLFLQENYGYSLWHFARSFIHNSFIWKDYREGRNIQTLEKGKRALEQVSNKYRLPPFPYAAYKHICEAIKEINIILEGQNKRGAPTKRINIIALVWSYFIRDNSNIHLANISGLLEWFFEKTEGSKFFMPFFYEAEKLNNKKLGKLIDRHKRNNTHAKDVEDGKRIFKQHAGKRAISFRKNDAAEMLINEEEENTALISFLNGEVLTVKDYLKNRKRTSPH